MVAQDASVEHTDHPSAEDSEDVESTTSIANHFPIGDIQLIDEIRSGLMHSTFRVVAESGTYTLQRLHKKLATAEIIGDYEAVTHYLYENEVEAPRLVRTRQNRPVYIDPEHRWWRLATWVEGEAHDKVTSIDQAEEGARALGRFHRVMSDFTHPFASQHPLHDTTGHLSNLRAASENPDYAEARRSVDSEIEQILKILPTLLLPDTLPQRVVHGDPKISNVLFDGTRAVGMIDLDTCNRHTLLVDIGDAIRSWCRDGHEDDKQHFQLDRFEAMMRGYAAEGPTLRVDEIEHLPAAGRLITMELSSRFARDVMEDEYFAFDSERYTTRRAHNIARTRAMLFLADDMKAHEKDMRALVTKYMGR